MTIINVNSISGINSITAQGASGIEFYDSSGNLNGDITLGVGATIKGFTNTITASTNGEERLRVDSAGNLGVNDTNPNFKLDVNGDIGIREGNNLVWHDASGTAAFRIRAQSDNILRFERASGNEPNLIIDDGNVGIGTDTIGNISNRSQLVIGGSTGGLLDFNVGSDTEARMFATDGTGLTIRAYQSDGEIVFQTGGSTEQARITADGLKLASGNGINFSAYATSGNPSSNLLDDYEEGTFTPTIDVTGTSGTLSISYSNQVGRYVKVGRIVHFTIDIRLSSWNRGTGTGGIMVVGLPFAPVDSGNFSRATGFCNLYDWNYSADSADIPVWSVYQNNNYPWVNIFNHREGNTNSDISDPGSNSMMFFSGTYEAGA